MDILIVTPPAGFPSGNRCTATQWADRFEELGHQARVAESYEGEDAEVLIALHAARNHTALVEFQRAHPNRKTVVVLTGTDLYPEASEDALDSMKLADRIVVLQPGARESIPDRFRDKAHVVVQSASTGAAKACPPNPDAFEVCVIGHLREVKDPMRTAAAARLLPSESRLQIRHAGRIQEKKFVDLVEREEAENPRYRYLGELTPAEVERVIGSSRLFILSSHHEGGARVLGEAVAAGTPILAARNDATETLLHDDYPGLFNPGDTSGLATLLTRAETDSEFLDSLTKRIEALAPQFDPGREREAWRRLLAELQEEAVSNQLPRSTGSS